MRYAVMTAVCGLALTIATSVQSQQIDWSKVDAELGKTASVSGDVHRYGFPRSDLQVSVDGVAIRPALALGGWAAFQSMGNQAMVMGDLVLLDTEVSPVMQRLLESGIGITAVHNHLLRGTPATLYMHIEGRGDPIKMATALRSALALSKTPLGAPSTAAPPAVELDVAQIEQIMGFKGQANGGVYQFTVPRQSLIHDRGMTLPAAMGTANAINFQSTGTDRAAITGDFVVIGDEVNPLIATLRAGGIEVTAIHSHMLNEQPRLFFVHFWANDDALKLARGVRAALDKTAIAKAEIDTDVNRPVNSAELVYLTRIATLVTAALLLIPDAFSAQPALVLDTTITMPDVRGRIDHLAIDEPGGRLFVAALGNNTVEIIDLKSRQRTGRLESLREPQGVAYVPNTGQLFVANGGGDVSIFAGMPPITSGRITGLDDADNVRLDAPGQHLYVGYGNALAAIDVVTQKVTDRISLAGHPEGFQLDPSGPRIYVNVPSAGEVAVLDRDTHRQIATWRLSDADGNFPMAIDAAHRRLLVGTRRPARLLAYDIDSGNVVATLPIGGDVDDIFLDVKRRRIYAICGEGVVTVIQQAADSDYQHAGDIKTAPGSRTGLLVPDRDALYVAVPTRAASPAEIRVYALQ